MLGDGAQAFFVVGVVLGFLALLGVFLGLGLARLFLPICFQLRLTSLLLALGFELCLMSLLLTLRFELGLAYLVLPRLFLRLRLPGCFLASGFLSRGFLARGGEALLLFARGVEARRFRQSRLFLTRCVLSLRFLTRQLDTLGVLACALARLLLGLQGCLAALRIAGGVELRLFFLRLLFLRQTSGFLAGGFYPCRFGAGGVGLFRSCPLCRHPVCCHLVLRRFFLGLASCILAGLLFLPRLRLALCFQPQIVLAGEFLAFGFLLGCLLRLPLDALGFLLQLFLPGSFALCGLCRLFRLLGLRHAEGIGPLGFSADDVRMCFVALGNLFGRLWRRRAISLPGKWWWRGNGLRRCLLRHRFHVGLA